METQPEVWLRGPVHGIPDALMPAAHAFLQTMEDVEQAAGDLTLDQLWQTPGGAASVGFHILHLAGSTDRLLTLRTRRAAVPQISRRRCAAGGRHRSGEPPGIPNRRTADRRWIRRCPQLQAVPLEAIYEARSSGPAALPTTVVGLMFHAAEHSQRHAGQLVTTAKIVRARAALGGVRTRQARALACRTPSTMSAASSSPLRDWSSLCDCELSPCAWMMLIRCHSDSAASCRRSSASPFR